MIFENLISQIHESNASVYTIALYENGTWREETLVPVPVLYQCFSLAKAFTATAIGIAQDKGLINITDPILKYFGNELPPAYDMKLEGVTIRHLLTHSMGNDVAMLTGEDRIRYKHTGYLKAILNKPLAYDAGAHFTYSNSNYYLLSLIIHRAGGVTLEAFLRKNLFDQIDITEYAFQNCPEGETLGATGLFMSVKDLAMLGVLYLNNGQYNGKQLISPRWVSEATRNQVRLDDAPPYGYSFFIEENGYCARANHGQAIAVLPNQKIVAAVNGYGDFDIYALLQSAMARR